MAFSETKFAVVVNSHSTYHDVLEVFLSTFREYCPLLKLYIFTDHLDTQLFKNTENVVIYEGNTFRDQFLFGLKQVKEDIILTLNDDYFILSPPKLALLNSFAVKLRQSHYSQIRLHRGPNFGRKTCDNNLHLLDLDSPFFYSQTATLWKLRDLIKLYEGTAPSGIARKGNEQQFEVLANETAKQLKLEGLVYFNGEKKRGKHHFDCSVFPYVASAIVDGRWNFLEYYFELKEIEQKFGCDLSLRHSNRTFFSRFLEPFYAYAKRFIL